MNRLATAITLTLISSGVATPAPPKEIAAGTLRVGNPFSMLGADAVDFNVEIRPGREHRSGDGVDPGGSLRRG